MTRLGIQRKLRIYGTRKEGRKGGRDGGKGKGGREGGRRTVRRSEVYLSELEGLEGPVAREVPCKERGRAGAIVE